MMRTIDAPIRIDGQGRVDDDLPCANCRYNLRTMLSDGRCPECGLPVESSLRHDVLERAPARWVAELKRGSKLFSLGALLSVVPPFYPGALLGVWGLLGMLRAQSARIEPMSDRVRRRVAVACLVIGFVGVFATIGVNYYYIKEFGLWAPRRVADGFFIGDNLFLAFGMMFGWDYLEILAKRIPDMALSRRCGRARKAYILALGIITVIGIAVWMKQSSQSMWMVNTAPMLIATVLAAVMLGLWLLTWRLARAWKTRLAGIGGR